VFEDELHKEYASFLYNSRMIDKQKLAEYFKKNLPQRMDILNEYFALFPFKRLSLDQALRKVF